MCAASRSRNYLSWRAVGVPQETAPQVWLVDPSSQGLLARLLAVLAGGPRGEERGAGEEEEGRAGEAAEKDEDGKQPLRRVQHPRFASGKRCAALWEVYATEEAPQPLRSWGQP